MFGTRGGGVHYNRAGEEEGEAAAANDSSSSSSSSPYAEFVYVLTTFVLPVFEGSATSPGTTAKESADATAISAPNTPSTPVITAGRSHASQSVEGSEANHSQSDGGSGGGGGDNGSGGGTADLFITGSINSEPLLDSDGTLLPMDAAETEAARTRSTARVIDLEVAGASEMKEDAETARALLPEPEVPAPDPKVFAIPPEKVRQLLRRPATRVQRAPLQRLELLPVVVVTEPPPQTPSSPSSQAGRSSKPKGSSKARDEQGEASSSAAEEIVSDEFRVEGGDQGRASSGALEGNPYRWVVSIS